MTLWWLSFCDGDRPKGEQFLGVAIVEAGDVVAAVKEAWRLGINPGGEVMILPTNPAKTPDAIRNRLLSKREVEAIIAADDAELAAQERAEK